MKVHLPWYLSWNWEGVACILPVLYKHGIPHLLYGITCERHETFLFPGSKFCQNPGVAINWVQWGDLCLVWCWGQRPSLWVSPVRWDQKQTVDIPVRISVCTCMQLIVQCHSQSTCEWTTVDSWNCIGPTINALTAHKTPLVLLWGRQQCLNVSRVHRMASRTSLQAVVLSSIECFVCTCTMQSVEQSTLTVVVSFKSVDEKVA